MTKTRWHKEQVGTIKPTAFMNNTRGYSEGSQHLIVEAIEHDEWIKLEWMAAMGGLESIAAFKRHRPTEVDQLQKDHLQYWIREAAIKNSWQCLHFLIQFCDQRTLQTNLWLIDLTEHEESKIQKMCCFELDLRILMGLGKALREAGITVEEGVVECFQ